MTGRPRALPVRYLIRGGDVVDGTGSPRRRSDVVVDGDRIASLGEAPAGDTLPEIDAEGLVVCPGFVDVHAHDDLALLRTPELLPKLTQGVTTTIVGNCGIGVVPPSDPLSRQLRGEDSGFSAVLGTIEEVRWSSIEGYLDLVAGARPALNVGFLIPHGALRLWAAGSEERPCSRDELQAMVEALRAAMDLGAAGISTGLIYPPARAAETAELVTLAEAVADAGGLYVTHLRNEADELSEAIDEALHVARSAGIGLHVSHLKVAGRSNWGAMPRIVERLSDAGDVTVDAYPYTAASTTLVEALGAAGSRSPVRPDEVLISSAPGASEAEGRTLQDLMDEWGVSDEEAVRRFEERCPSGVTVVYFVMTGSDVGAALGFDRCMVGSDGLHTGSRPHPRLWGTFPRVLHRCVASSGAFSLEEAIRRMSGLPASRFGLRDRGVVRPGAYADLVILDPVRVEDRATYVEPQRAAAGIEAVIVNGRAVLLEGVPTGERAGRPLTFHRGGIGARLPPRGAP
jgi:N-acyl-D-amino-acid deacylase